jgi:hypothetical protein
MPARTLSRLSPLEQDLGEQIDPRPPCEGDPIELEGGGEEEEEHTRTFTESYLVAFGPLSEGFPFPGLSMHATSLFAHQVSPSRAPPPTTFTIGVAWTSEDQHADHGHMPPLRTALLGTARDDEDAPAGRPIDIICRPIFSVINAPKIIY